MVSKNPPIFYKFIRIVSTIIEHVSLEFDPMTTTSLITQKENCKDNLAKSKMEFETILNGLNANERKDFCYWLNHRLLEEKTNSSFDRKARRKLGKIAKRLREITPVELCLNNGVHEHEKDEQLFWPTGGAFADCRQHNTVQVDSFLFDEDDLDELEQKGLLRRHYCLRCNSTDCAPLTFISHSLSVDELEHLFASLLPSLGVDLAGKVFVDIGSRFGAALYAAALYCPSIGSAIGIERSPAFDSLQRKIVAEFGFTPPIGLQCADFRECDELLAKADIVLMHNVFGFFADEREQVDCWRRLKSMLRPNATLVHSPSLETVTAHLELGFSVASWLEKVYPQTIDESNINSDESFFVYRVR